MKKLNIVILTGSNPYNNAGIVAFDMYASLKSVGHSVQIITKYFDDRFTNGINSVYNKHESNILKFKTRLFNKLSFVSTEHSYYMHSVNEYKRQSITNKIAHKIKGNVDVFIYLFPHGFLNFKDLNILCSRYNAFIFMVPVDMALFTGGCHYSNSCTRFKMQCGNCPGLNSNNENDRTKKNILFKKKYFSKDKFITLSNTWLSAHLKMSSVFSGIKDFYLSIVVNDNVFMPLVSSSIREKYSIPKNKKVIFFGAAYINEERKGLKYLLEAINLLSKDLSEIERSNTIILVAGALSDNFVSLMDFNVITLGHLAHNELVHAFQMADVYVSPSIQDAGPMMVIQSMMCGTPVVSFEMGNAVDFIEEDVTGFMVPLYNIKLLKEKIKLILQKNDNELTLMRLKCRKKAVKESSYESFANKITTIYKQVCST